MLISVLSAALVSKLGASGRAALAEQLADIDDSFAELVLDDDYDPAALAPGQLKAALRKAAIARTGVPILCGTARRNKGVQPYGNFDILFFWTLIFFDPGFCNTHATPRAPDGVVNLVSVLI